MGPENRGAGKNLPLISRFSHLLHKYQFFLFACFSFLTKIVQKQDKSQLSKTGENATLDKILRV